MKRVALALGALLMLVGCAPGQIVTPDPSASASESIPVSTADPDDLAELKAASGIEDCAEVAPGPVPPDGLPDIVLPCLGGGASVPLSGLRGPMVINLWAQWCGPCRAEAPFLTEVADALAGSVEFLGIDYSDPRPELAIEFAEDAGWTYPQLVDEPGLLRAPLQIAGPPMTILLDADGRIAYTHRGQIASADQLRQLIHDHLGVT